VTADALARRAPRAGPGSVRVARADIGVLASLRKRLLAAGYAAADAAEFKRLARATTPNDAGSIVRARGVYDPLVTLLELLWAGGRVSSESARRALAPLTVDELARIGLLRADREWVRPSCSVAEHDGLLVFGDPPSDDRQDVVMALSSISEVAACLTPRKPCRTMLDLGTGSGVQALLAARHCQRVVGVDVNPRALWFAALGQAANQVDNVEWRHGSWFEPVAGERFDLVVANPPYLISPDHEFTYRDSDTPDICARLSRQAPAHLEEDGLAILLCMWGHADEEGWEEIPRSWVTDSGCDAIIVCFQTHDSLAHAVGWNSPPARGLAPPVLRDNVARWVRYLEDRGIGAVSFGAIVLRRRTCGRNWTAVTRASGTCEGEAARQLARIFDGNDLLSSGEDLLRGRYSIPEGASVSQRFVRGPGGWVERVANVSVPGELGVSASVDPDALDVLFRCDGHSSLGALLDDQSQAPAVEEAVRALLGRGLLIS
jgi:SAM-dependent methyltransferase